VFWKKNTILKTPIEEIEKMDSIKETIEKKHGTTELSLPKWSEVKESQQVNPVPCFSETRNPVPCFQNEPIPYTGDVPEWVNIVFGWSEAETIRAYAKVEVIHDRRGEESAQKWILENSRNFLDSAIDDKYDTR
jgi:hypothetical protein